MATIDYNELILVDGWPGVPATTAETPVDGFVDGAHNNSTDEVFPVGSKMQVYNDGTTGLKGFATLVYLKAAEAISAAGTVVVQDDSGVPYVVANTTADVLAEPIGLAAISLSAVASGSYGWFWCGGVFPAVSTGLTPSITASVVPGPVSAGDISAAIGLVTADIAGEFLFGYSFATSA